MKYYSVNKCDNLTIYDKIDGPRRHCTNAVSQTEKDKYYMISLYVESKIALVWHSSCFFLLKTK